MEAPDRKAALVNYIKSGAFYKAVVEDGSDIIFIVDYNGNILYLNHAVLETVGHQPKDLIGKNFFDFINPAMLTDLRAQFSQSTLKPFDENIEFHFLCKNNTYKYLEFNSINLKHKNDVEGLILDCRDISQRKKDAEELLKAQKTKEQFLANMSHEIRTPINGISGMATLLSDTDDPEERKKYIDAIRNSAESLKVIINDILDISSIEAGKMKFERIGFSIRNVLENLYNTFIHQAKEKGITLEYEIDPEADIIVIGDPVRLSQILINLLGNALKFTHVGSIELNVTVKKRDRELYYMAFDVSDTGIGISKDKLEHIFDSFAQADASVTRRYGGSGLGLTISKQLVELQNGIIKVKSVENKGSSFRFVIPYFRGKKQDLKTTVFEDQEENNEDTLAPGNKILVVEDNDVNRLFVVKTLIKWDCLVTEAENGHIAIEKLKKEDFDLVLMDVQMPVMDGLEATIAIRNKFRGKKAKVPIVALTANAIEGDNKKCLDAGMDDYLTKPFKPRELKTMLLKRLSQKRNGAAPKTGPKPLVDLGHLQEVCYNDKGFIKEMVEVFLRTIPKALEEIGGSIKHEEWEETGNAAHKIKPSISFMGIENAIQLIQDIEKCSKNKTDLEVLPHKFERFKELCDRACVEFEDLLKNGTFS